MEIFGVVLFFILIGLFVLLAVAAESRDKGED